MAVVRGVVVVAACCLLAASACKRATQTQEVAKDETARPCRGETDCPPDEYCAYAPALCGKGHVPGVCRLKPRQCAEATPVCGCDGKVYGTACAAHASGVDLAELGGCKTPVFDFIPCGQRYCDARTSYCEIYLSDVLEPPTTHACRPLPESCKPGASHPPECDCFPSGTPCTSFCGPMWTGGVRGFHLTCQGVRAPAATTSSGLPVRP
ncbi:MAG TPA: hypothetical protein VHU80_22525 [Polyangiaceae bacterium]|nr:hypothetical protein [Polyangiaceae bacterium]